MSWARANDHAPALRRFRTLAVRERQKRASQRCVKTPEKLKKIEAGVNFTEAIVEIGHFSVPRCLILASGKRNSGLRALQNRRRPRSTWRLCRKTYGQAVVILY
jgi:hypothetical protein